MGLEIIPLLTGLFSSLLSGMEEQDEALQKGILEMLGKINKIVGDKIFVNTLWYILLKNSKNRIASFKILLRKFGEKNKDDDENKEVLESRPNQLQEIYEHILHTDGTKEAYFANPWLIVNAFVKCFEDDDVSTRKICLDFMIKHIDVRSDEIFNDAQRMLLFQGVIKLIETNDLAMLKRVFKLLFNSNEINKLEEDQTNNKTVSLIAQGFSKVFRNMPKTEEDVHAPFKVLYVAKEHNEALARQLIIGSALPIVEFCHEWGYLTPNDLNAVVVEQTKKFIEDFAPFFEDLLSSFLSSFYAKQLEDTARLEFAIKVFVVKSPVRAEAKFNFIISCMDLTFTQLNSHFDDRRSLIPSLTHLPSVGNESSVGKTRRLEKVVRFLGEAAIILGDLLKEDENAISQDMQNRLGELLDRDSSVIESLFRESQPDSIIVDNYSQFFIVLMKIDVLKSHKNPVDPNRLNFDDLPIWLKTQFTLIESKHDNVAYAAMRFLLSLFDYENANPLIATYNSFIYNRKEHYEEDALCWKIMFKISDLIEINDFKRISLAFLFKFLNFNLHFVTKFLLHLLKDRSPEGFKKVSYVWLATSGFSNSDIRLVLNDTVFQMLTFVEINDPLIKNHFKNWLTQSKDNFIIILDAVLKELIRCTNWRQDNGSVVYAVPFSCDGFHLGLKHLKTILNYSVSNFMHYVEKYSITPEFEFYLEEIVILLPNVYKNPPKTYLFFIVQMFLRYLVGELALHPDMDKAVVEEHLEKIPLVKEEIIMFLEKLISNLQDPKLQADVTIPLIKVASAQLEKALHENKLTLQLSYLNFLEFLFFKTKSASLPESKDALAAALQDPQFWTTFQLGLGNPRYFIIKEFTSFGAQINFLIAKFFKDPILTQMVRSTIFTYLDNIAILSEQENDLREQEQRKEGVSALLQGLQLCLEFFLQVNEIEEKIESSNINKVFVSVFTLGIVQTKEEIRRKISFLKDENTCRHILSMFESIFRQLVKCWKDTGLILAPELYLRFNPQTTYLRDNGENVAPMGVSGQILTMLIPLSTNFLEKTIEAFVQNWIENNEKLKFNEFSSNDDDHYENLKLLEMLLMLKISPIRVLVALLNSKQARNIASLRRYEPLKSKKDHYLIRETLTYECNFLSFLFSYLKYVHTTENVNFEVYGIVLKIFRNLEATITPLTLAWMLDILGLVIEKFPLSMVKFQSLKSEWSTFLSDLLMKNLRLVLREIGVIYKGEGRDFVMAGPLNPSLRDPSSQFHGRSQMKYSVICNDCDLNRRVYWKHHELY